MKEVDSIYRRVTIMMSNRLDSQIRDLQASLIKKSRSSVSYSSVINMLVANGLKPTKK